ncbi:hypothetical protein IAG44_25300 [Streptomyces roseirectus]|uniref:Uncharacterized protein n=1 Tax=Streptomyces roseirectus TaxID=2768066 RepID=A0A7H0IHZ2_9ACTN|nr:Imm50 family immunity protein [Streptomyces roseirectus]QNP72408.1 hypothetical protein IAG44_25300 [Streptomyces roseirectus]
MSASEWPEAIGSPDVLGRLYEGSVPTPEECSLYYVHVDERGRSVTVGFETKNLPSRPLGSWNGEVYNTLEFFLLFLEVEDFSVNRWGAEEAAEFSVSTRSRGGFSVFLGNGDSGIKFQAGSVTLQKSRVYLAVVREEG